MIAKTEEVEFQRLRLDHTFARQIVDANLREVRLSRDRAQARELRAVEANPVVVLRMLVLKRLQHLGRIAKTVLRLPTEPLKGVLFSVPIVNV